jgi:hypothetical protein
MANTEAEARMMAVERDLRQQTGAMQHRGDGKAVMPVVVLDADSLVRSLVLQRDAVNKLFGDMIAIASQYRLECDAFVQRINDVMHEKISQ